MSRKKNEITILCKSSARVGTDAFVRPCGPDVSGRRVFLLFALSRDQSRNGKLRTFQSCFSLTQCLDPFMLIA